MPLSWGCLPEEGTRLNTLKSVLRRATKHVIVGLILGALLGAAGASLLLLTASKEYRATGAVVLEVVGGENVEKVPAIDAMIASATSLITSPQVVDPAGKSVTPKIGTDQILKGLSVNTPAQSLVFWFSFKGEEKQSEALVKAIGTAFQKEVDGGAIPSYGGLSIKIKTITYSKELLAEGEVGKMSLALVAGAICVFIAASYVFVRILLDNRVRTESDLAEVTDEAVIGAGGGETAAAKVAAGLKYLVEDSSANIIAFTGVGAASGEFAKEVARNVAGKSVVVVDLDLGQRPLGDGKGLVDVATGEAKLADVVVDGDVKVVPAGGPVPNPAEFLTRDAVKRALEGVALEYDWVLVTASALLVTSAGLLGAQLGDAAVVVVKAGKTSREEVRAALNLAEASHLDVAAIAIV